MKRTIFGGLTHAEFMRRHWQKKPLVVRRALPSYASAVTREDVIRLAGRDDVEARIVMKTGRRRHIQHGPFTRRDIARLPRSGWTLLVQGVDLVLPPAARLLREFAFIPYARLDDVMVSYAAPGGGVGPHFDSYDVFLLQGAGQRRWQMGQQRDLTLLPDLPLRILRNFEPDTEVFADSGDIVYLPPRWAHDGVATGECITYSIGFRAPSAQELGVAFLEFLADRLDLDGRYEDPDLEPTRTPGRIPGPMIARTTAMLEDVRWSRRDIVRFLGCHLSEPKPNVLFATPRAPRTEGAFGNHAERAGVKLVPRSRMLAYKTEVFVNGEAHPCDRHTARVLARLADDRQLAPPLKMPSQARRLLYEWYRAGYLESGTMNDE